MEKKKDRDIVDKIIDRLKSDEELPYREGAWERFRATKLTKKRRFSPMWAAAALCLLGTFGSYWLWDKQDGAHVSQSVDTEQFAVGSQENTPASSRTETEREPNVGTNNQRTDEIELFEEGGLITYQPSDRTKTDGELPYLISSVNPEVDRSPRVIMPDLALSRQQVTGMQSRPSVRGPISLENHVLAQDHQTMTVQVEEVNGQNKHFRLSEKFSLGLVVSPSRTDQRVNFGGGLLLSYNIGKNLSIRTGATFHQYEVGILKDPVQSAPMEVAKTSDRPLQAENFYSAAGRQSSMMAGLPLIPNVNAVSGNVQTIDIPLEAKYTIYKGFYAGAGVSYAAILNQTRYAHYVENVNADPYAKGLPTNEAEMRTAVQPVTQTIESASNNVNPSGFGGFVNMSLGKDIKVGRSVSLSLEPYVKLPVGNFRRADMNYTNSGVRIITNF